MSWTAALPISRAPHRKAQVCLIVMYEHEMMITQSNARRLLSDRDTLLLGTRVELPPPPLKGHVVNYHKWLYFIWFLEESKTGLGLPSSS
jgi:hypothetical protein